MIHVPSTEGVNVAVHELGAQGNRRPLLISHATGFHAHCYTPIASQLADRFRCLGLDYRGHGETPVDPEWPVDWQRFGDDASAVARHIAPGGGLLGIGHSMGGSALLMAAHRDPDRFDRLVLFEPISHEGSRPTLTEAEIREFPIVVGAMRRRRRFASFDEAYENFRNKPPLSSMVDEALRNYVDHGFRPAPVDDDGTSRRRALRARPSSRPTSSSPVARTASGICFPRSGRPPWCSADTSRSVSRPPRPRRSPSGSPTAPTYDSIIRPTSDRSAIRTRSPSTSVAFTDADRPSDSTTSSSHTR